MSRGVAVRLPLLLALVVGAWLWRSSFFPQPRELVVLLPPTRAPVTHAEVQLYSDVGDLLAREERSVQDGAGLQVLRLEISLRRGRYLCRAFLRDQKGAERSLSQAVDLGGERTVEIELR